MWPCLSTTAAAATAIRASSATSCRAELERSEPEQARALHRAAAGRAAEIGAVEEALEHAAAAGDVGRVADLAERLAVSACGRGRLDAVERWLDLVQEDDAENHPDLCIAASWLHALRGRAANAQHWADTAMRGLGGGDPRLDLLQGLRCRDGAEQMLDDTSAACEALPSGTSLAAGGRARAAPQPCCSRATPQARRASWCWRSSWPPRPEPMS